MYLLEPGYSLGPESNCLILEASRQPRSVSKPERMTSDGGKSASGREGPPRPLPLAHVLRDANMTFYLKTTGLFGLT